MEKEWKILKPDPAVVRRIARRLKCSPVLASVLANRNLHSDEELSAFFDPSFQRIRTPFCMTDIEPAAERICDAIQRRENILVFGDYDVDGVTATTMMTQFLQKAGAQVAYYIPHRIREGYGLRPQHITDVAVPREIHVIITVDCGISSHPAVEAANAAGIDVIVTDHHQVTETLPEALAIINPQRQDCLSGLEHLAGVGVAFYLLVAIRKHLRDRKHWNTEHPEPNLKEFCDLVALGTVADLVPLVSENRVLVSKGLEVLNTGSRIGLKALQEICMAAGGSVESDDIAFRLAPRLNAAGRMRHAKLAVRLLTADNAEAALAAARNLGELNRSRQILEKEITADIRHILEDHPKLLESRTLVLSHPVWHPGLLGIAASRVAEQYHRPVVLFSEKTVPWKGSARGIPGLDLYRALQTCASCLNAFGGHKMAAGLSILPERLANFRKAFERAAERLFDEEAVRPVILIDQELNLNQISDRLLDELESLQPFGNQNREPLFLSRDVRVHYSAQVGENHRRMRLGHSAGNQLNGIQFNVPPETMALQRFDKMAFRLRWNRWNGRKSIQIMVEDIGMAES